MTDSFPLGDPTSESVEHVLDRSVTFAIKSSIGARVAITLSGFPSDLDAPMNGASTEDLWPTLKNSFASAFGKTGDTFTYAEPESDDY